MKSDNLESFISLISIKLGKGGLASSGIWGNHNHAAVLVPILEDQNELKFLFTKRTEFIATHKGQISFPGGKAEENDQDPRATAMRETCEEIGAGENDIHTLGEMKPVSRPDGLIVTPVIGILNWPIELRLSAMEVSKVFTVPLWWFSNINNIEFKEIIDHRGNVRPVIYYRQYGEEVVWGLTAKIIHNFVDLIN